MTKSTKLHYRHTLLAFDLTNKQKYDLLHRECTNCAFYQDMLHELSAITVNNNTTDCCCNHKHCFLGHDGGYGKKKQRPHSVADFYPSKNEYDLEQKIELEIKMREGTTRLLAACRHQQQSLEAARSLLVSTERMSAYMEELQRRKHQSKIIKNLTPCTAKVSLSDLRMPLIWRDIDHFKNKGDHRRFAVFCLARIATEIYATTLLCPVDRSSTDLQFHDILLFNRIPSNFELKLEVYSHILEDDLSIASTSRKIKNTIHSSISKAVGKKLATLLKDELNSGKIGPHFELMATARLTLNDAHNSIQTHDLVTIQHDNRAHQLPLFGHFCCRLAVQPDCVSQEVYSGQISLLYKQNKFKQYWAQLQAFRLELWETQSHWEQGKDHLKSIIIDRNTTIKKTNNKNNEIIIQNGDDSGNEINEEYKIYLKSQDEQMKWFKHLQQHIDDHIIWKHCAENIMHIQTPGSNTRAAFNTRSIRHGSLYDETPLIVSTEYQNHRPTVQEIFGLTPSASLSSCASSSSSPTTFRERSFSSSGGSATLSSTNTNSSSGTETTRGKLLRSGNGRASGQLLRSHWPFNKQE
ncbi:rhotekin-like isoform X4 [Chrysoperla carnea]|uniref:rhotekin-like isoform X4 n=1 Tax=Chrysoperla carnea TaxID=189513 RepID=UPI001D07593B|nr:rhotekin-like isoform X4 [Chrysoperla carnea]